MTVTSFTLSLSQNHWIELCPQQKIGTNNKSTPQFHKSPGKKERPSCKRISSWRFQPICKILSSKWKSSPSRDENQKKHHLDYLDCFSFSLGGWGWPWPKTWVYCVWTPFLKTSTCWDVFLAPKLPLPCLFCDFVLGNVMLLQGFPSSIWNFSNWTSCLKLRVATFLVPNNYIKLMPLRDCSYHCHWYDPVFLEDSGGKQIHHIAFPSIIKGLEMTPCKEKSSSSDPYSTSMSMGGKNTCFEIPPKK